MKTIEYTFKDKSRWGEGPWQQEPDKKQWRDEATGLPCLIVRGPHGALCGYAGVPAGHPFFGVSYHDVPAEVHGGLTFADHCRPGKGEHGICHAVEEGEDDRVWWLGFDCAHAWDHTPGTCSRAPFLEEATGEYRDWAYVEDQVRLLAAQLASVTRT